MATAQPMDGAPPPIGWWRQWDTEVPHSVPILVPDPEHEGRLTLDVPALCSVLMRPEIRHLPVVVIAASGAFRRGKSFLLSLLLRFLDAGGDPRWLSDGDQPLHKGFAWRSGRKRHTVGMHMWSHPARVRLPGSGKEVAVVLMDTQGAFDSQTTVAENANIFALSALTSSVQIYNIANNIGSDDLQHLALFTELGRTACEAHGERPLQKLLLLVRDWQAPSELAYGADGGRRLLTEAFDCSPSARDELRSMRHRIEDSFSEMDCFLMPHPGKKVATSSTFTGTARDIDEDFLKSLDELARMLLLPENLRIKRVAGKEITAADLVTHFTELFGVLRSGQIPEAQSLVNTMSEANNLASVSESTALYTELMAEVCSETSPPLPEESLEQHSRDAVEAAVGLFANTKKMLGGASEAKYKDKLLTELQHIREKVFEGNRLKIQLEEAKAKLACQEAYQQAQEQYRRAIVEEMERNREQLENAELANHFQRQREAALQLFDRHLQEQDKCDHDEQRSSLQRWLADQEQQTLVFNAQRGSAEANAAEQDRRALEEARLRYREIMENVRQRGPLPEDRLAEAHQRAETEARQVFHGLRGQRHSATPQVDRFMDRNIEEEANKAKKHNIIQVVIDAVVSAIPVLVTKLITSAKCIIM